MPEGCLRHRLVSGLKRRRCHRQVAYRPKVRFSPATAAPQNKRPSDTSDDRFLAGSPIHDPPADAGRIGDKKSSPFTGK